MEAVGNEFYSEVRMEERERLLRKKDNESKKKEKDTEIESKLSKRKS